MTLILRHSNIEVYNNEDLAIGVQRSLETKMTGISHDWND